MQPPTAFGELLHSDWLRRRPASQLCQPVLQSPAEYLQPFAPLWKKKHGGLPSFSPFSSRSSAVVRAFISRNVSFL